MLLTQPKLLDRVPSSPLLALMQKEIHCGNFPQQPQSSPSPGTSSSPSTLWYSRSTLSSAPRRLPWALRSDVSSVGSSGGWGEGELYCAVAL